MVVVVSKGERVSKPGATYQLPTSLICILQYNNYVIECVSFCVIQHLLWKYKKKCPVMVVLYSS